MTPRRLLSATLACALSAPLSGCLSYNDSCQPLVPEPDAVVGYLAEDVQLDKSFTRHDNNAMGQLVADAFLHAADGEARPAQLGIVNGGSLRDEGLCVTRTALRKGPLTDGVLHEIILFENLVVTVDLTEKQVVDMLELSASALYTEGQLIASPSGAFLQISEGTSVHIDCSRERGQRVTQLSVRGITVPLPPRTDTNVRYRVAMPKFLLDGGDGYDAVFGNAGTDPDRNPVTARKLGGTDANLTSAYMKEKYPTPVQSLHVEGRVVFENCALPTRPGGG